MTLSKPLFPIVAALPEAIPADLPRPLTRWGYGPFDQECIAEKGILGWQSLRLRPTAPDQRQRMLGSISPHP
jgi:hypothetical protein